MKMNQQIHQKIKEIEEHLDSISEHMAWLISAEQRFQIGQRVEWSRKGKAQGFLRRKNCHRGTVKGVNSFTITVQLDGLKHASKFHHAFFNPISGPKLF